MRVTLGFVLFAMLAAGCTGTESSLPDPSPLPTGLDAGDGGGDANVKSDGNAGDSDVCTPVSYNVSTWAGANGSGTGTLQGPSGIAFDHYGNLYVSNTEGHRISKITPDGTITPFAGTGTATPLNTLDSNATFDCKAATFRYPQGIAVEQDGSLLVADIDNNVIRRITVTAANTCTVSTAATGFSGPWGVTVDASGNIYVADSGNSRVCRVTKDGTCTVILGFGNPVDTVMDANGNIYVADYDNNVIRLITTNNTVSTFAGSDSVNDTGTRASFYNPESLAIDTCGNLYVADAGNNAVRKVSPTGDVKTIAGTGPADTATLNHPAGIALGADGVIYVADQHNQRILKLTPVY